MKNLFCSIVLLVMFSTQLFSQAGIVSVKGYVITLKGDTLRGDIKLNPKKELEVFEKVTIALSATEKKSFKPDKIKGYNIDTANFVSKKLDGDALVFYKVLSAGKLNLYEYQYYWEKASKDVTTKSEYYVEKEGEDKLTKIKQAGKYKKQLSELMSDNTEALSDVDEKEFNIEQIMEAFKQYNAGN
jgi:hypothetical protein